MKTIFFGSGDYTIPIIEKLIPHGLTLVITTEKVGSLMEFCKSKQIDYISTNLKGESDRERIKNLQADVAVLASFGAFIPEKIIKSIKYGIINIHPSLLPKWKGPSPIQYTLLHGNTQTGATLIELDNEIDHGPILSQMTYDLDGSETTEELLKILFSQGANMLDEILVKIKNKTPLIKTPQDHTKETWSYKIEKGDGMIDINNPPTPEQLDRMIRAYYPWPSVWLKTHLKGQEKLVKLLPKKKIQVEGKNPMYYADFLNGYGKEGSNLLEKLSLQS